MASIKKNKIFEDFPEICEKPKYNGQNMTNRVLIQQSANKERGNRLIYYCPAYLRLQIKNFSDMDHQDLNAQVNSVIILTINFNGIPPLLEMKIRSLIKISFNRDDSLKIRQTSKAITVNSEGNGVYTFIIQKSVHVAMSPDVFLSPFQIIYLIMSISINDIQINKSELEQIMEESELRVSFMKSGLFLENNERNLSGDNQQDLIQRLEEESTFLKNLNSVQVKFNLMDTDLHYMKIIYNQAGDIGIYSLAQSQMLLKSQYTNQSTSKKIREKQQQKRKSIQQKKNKNKKQTQQKIKRVDHALIKPFCYAHFDIPLYKIPIVTLTTIFFPLWLLSVLTLGIFYQDKVLADRIGNLAGLQIAFIALIGVIRDQIPQSPNVTFVQILVYMQIFSGILLFSQSIDIRNKSDYVFVWSQNWLFLFSAIILGLQILIICTLMLVHKIKWQKDYNRSAKKRYLQFNRLKWMNADCDKHFQRKIDSRVIKAAKINPQVQKIKQKLFKLTEDQMKQMKQLLQKA